MVHEECKDPQKQDNKEIKIKLVNTTFNKVTGLVAKEEILNAK